MKEKAISSLPEVSQIEAELDRESYRHRYSRAFRGTVCTLITVAAVAVLIATLWLPVLQTYGNSMSPTIGDGNIVIATKTGDFKTSDIVAFYYNNKILVKRVIAGPGDWVNITDDGTVYVNDVELDEPYITNKALGDCNTEFPYQVPESRYFVMGDSRSISVDSRNTMIGCVADEQIIGKVVFCVWPMNNFGTIN